MPLQAIPEDRPLLPFVGRLFEVHSDTLALLQRLYRRHGPVVWTRAAGVRFLALFGPDGAELVLRNKRGLFSNRLGWQHYLDHVFPGAVLAMDGSEHRYHRRIIQAAFVPDALRAYVERMNPTIAATIGRWRGIAHDAGGELLAYPALKQLTLDVATTTFMGIALTRDVERVHRAFIDMVEASLAVIRFDVWPLSYAKGVRGRRYLLERFFALLPDKRRAPGDDLLSQLCVARSEDGERFTDAEVVDHMVFIMMAAHDTSTSTLATLLYLLAAHPRWQARLRARSLEAPSDLLDYDQLGALELHEWAIMEALRLYPPLPFMPRVATEPIELERYVIPQGSVVGVAPLLNHRLPTLWSDPDRFDPERFSPERAEHKRHRYAWTPFGGGAHLCIGRHFAMLEIASTLHQLLRRYRWSVRPGYRMPYQHIPIAKPRDGLPLILEPLDS